MAAKRVLLGVSKKLYHGIRSELEQTGYRVAMATSFEEFMTMARNGRYDFLVMDRDCEEMPGIELAKVLALDEALRDTPRSVVHRRAGEEPQKVIEQTVSSVQWYFDAPKYCQK